MNRGSLTTKQDLVILTGETHTMKVLIHRAGACDLTAGAKFSRLCMIHVVCRKKIVDYLTCLRDARLPPVSLHHSLMLQNLYRGRGIGIGFLNGAVVMKGREDRVPTPVNTCIVSLICSRESSGARGE
jgi:hypothetical protein